MILNNGGEYTGINKGLSVLIIGDSAVPEKIDKAKKFGAKIYDEKSFMSMFDTSISDK